MKPLAILTLAVALCAFAVPAQAESSHWFGYTGGVSYPKGELKEWTTHAYEMGLTYDYMVIPEFGFGGEVSYSAWTNSQRTNDEVLAFFGPGIEEKQSDWSYTVHALARLPLAGPIQPYAKAGAGYFASRAALTQDTLVAFAGKSYFGHVFAAGVSCPITRTVRFNVEGSFRQYRGNSDNPVLWRYWSGTAQLLFRMPWSTKISAL